MSHEQQDKFEQRIAFVAKHYNEKKLNTDEAWKRFAAGSAIRKRIPLRRYVAGIAAVFVLLIGFGIVYLMHKNTPDWVIVNTLSNQSKDVYLPDSTLVSLAGDSKIKYNRKDFNQKRRTVEMNGKAFFQVKQDVMRPFAVKTTYTVTTVVGTSFQIEEREEATKINVASGKVLFEDHSEGDKNLLTAGMSAEYNAENKRIAIQVADNDMNYLSWKTQTLIFHETPLERVIRDLNECFNVQIINEKGSLDLKLTATFNDLSLEETLFIINQTLDTHLTVVSKP
ncbi:FecR domain-containing protein [Parabacteroides sp. PF5-9]|uniref:FecR family protein n=1 Tax=Parabacteroides sp. PF5-9 TaxID=1742404 RepID=UPI0024737B23|nr:FecR domain-containing protein [Parabacteroides sp. PF5-9]MDH6359047.1 transmembrane sensor [Parabacteroides sp. PF5-9]